MATTNKSITTLNDLKTPKGSFLLGNLKDFKKKNKHRILEKWAKDFGNLYTIKLGPLKVLVSADLEVNNTVLKQRPENFRRLSKIDEVFVEMGFHTVFNAEGEHWKKQRKPVTEALNVKKVKGYYPIIQEKTQNLLSKINTYTTSNQSIEILNDFIAFTIDVTTEIAFGYKLNTINNKKDSFQNHLELIFPMINDRITAPYPLWRFFPSKKDKKLKSSLKSIEKIIYDFIKDAKNKKIIRFLKAKLTSTNDGKLEIEVLKGQESFRIKSFVASNVWGLFKDGQSKFKKGELIDCYSPVGSNINIFK